MPGVGEGPSLPPGLGGRPVAEATGPQAVDAGLVAARRPGEIAGFARGEAAYNRLMREPLPRNVDAQFREAVAKLDDGEAALEAKQAASVATRAFLRIAEATRNVPLLGALTNKIGNRTSGDGAFSPEEIQSLIEDAVARGILRPGSEVATEAPAAAEPTGTAPNIQAMERGAEQARADLAREQQATPPDVSVPTPDVP